MKKITIRAKDREFNDDIFTLFKAHDYWVSNPDQKTGEFIDVIIKEDQQFLGFDLIANDEVRNVYEIIDTDDINIVKDWIVDHDS